MLLSLAAAAVATLSTQMQFYLQNIFALHTADHRPKNFSLKTPVTTSKDHTHTHHTSHLHTSHTVSTSYHCHTTVMCTTHHTYTHHTLSLHPVTVILLWCAPHITPTHTTHCLYILSLSYYCDVHHTSHLHTSHTVSTSCHCHTTVMCSRRVVFKINTYLPTSANHSSPIVASVDTLLRGSLVTG